MGFFTKLAGAVSTGGLSLATGDEKQETIGKIAIGTGAVVGGGLALGAAGAVGGGAAAGEVGGGAAAAESSIGPLTGTVEAAPVIGESATVVSSAPLASLPAGQQSIIGGLTAGALSALDKAAPVILANELSRRYTNPQTGQTISLPASAQPPVGFFPADQGGSVLPVMSNDSGSKHALAVAVALIVGLIYWSNHGR
jgi:hypothetical protein